MGNIAEMNLGGFLCQNCGAVIDGKEPGYPRNCEECDQEIGGILNDKTNQF